jgi:hypothetical protein
MRARFYWLGVQEANNPDAAPWLFQSDLAPLMWKALRCSSTNYVTEERDLTMLIKQPHPPLTGYRLLLSFLVTIFGLTKAILTYIGGKTMPNTIDWVFGVVVTIGYDIIYPSVGHTLIGYARGDSTGLDCMSAAPQLPYQSSSKPIIQLLSHAVGIIPPNCYIALTFHPQSGKAGP